MSHEAQGEYDLRIEVYGDDQSKIITANIEQRHLPATPDPDPICAWVGFSHIHKAFPRSILYDSAPRFKVSSRFGMVLRSLHQKRLLHDAHAYNLYAHRPPVNTEDLDPPAGKYPRALPKRFGHVRLQANGLSPKPCLPAGFFLAIDRFIPSLMFEMTRVRLLLLLLTLLASFVHAADGKPNIIFIMADDLGYGELGCYGQQKIQTPNIDRMAREGLRFTRFYAGATVCAPSRSVLMTGQHTGHTTVRGNAGRNDRTPQTLRSNDVTVAEMLKTAGYKTGLVGKWGLGMDDEGHPNRQGFDYFFGYLSQVHAHNHFPDHLWRNFEKVPLRNRIVPMAQDGAGYATNAVQFAGDLFAEEVMDFIDRSTNQPFFLYFAPVVPHANNERKRALGNGMEVPDFGPYRDEPWEDALKGHAAMVTRLDSDIGRIRRHLKVLGLEKNTLIIFTSDNGPHKEGGQDAAFFNPSGRLNGYKRDLTDGGICVPFIAAWPTKIQPGVSPHVGYFGDMMATFAELAGATPPGKIDSISLVPTLLRRDSQGRAVSQNRIQSQHRHLYWEFHEGGFSQAVLIGGRWKGIRMKRLDAPIQLYDLHVDPAETRNVAATHPVLVKQVEFLFRSERTDSPLWPVKEAAVRGNQANP